MSLQSELPADHEHRIPLALDTALNRIVRFQVAATANEAAEFIALLPAEVAHRLTADLAVFGEAHRFGLDAQRAFYFRDAGAALNIWSWNEVDSYDEAATLLTLIVNLEQELSEELANSIYVRATGRSVTQPRTMHQDRNLNGA